MSGPGTTIAIANVVSSVAQLAAVMVVSITYLWCQIRRALFCWFDTMLHMSEETTDEAIEFAHQLFDAVRAGNAEFVLTAIDQGVPIDLTDAKGNTLLMLAAYHSHGELVAGLVDRGADINRLNDRGQSPLAGAVFKRADDVIRVLLAHGADPEAGSPTARATARMFGIDLVEHISEGTGAKEHNEGGEAD